MSLDFTTTPRVIIQNDKEYDEALAKYGQGIFGELEHITHLVDRKKINTKFGVRFQEVYCYKVNEKNSIFYQEKPQRNLQINYKKMYGEYPYNGSKNPLGDVVIVLSKNFNFCKNKNNN